MSKYPCLQSYSYFLPSLLNNLIFANDGKMQNIKMRKKLKRETTEHRSKSSNKTLGQELCPHAIYLLCEFMFTEDPKPIGSPSYILLI